MMTLDKFNLDVLSILKALDAMPFWIMTLMLIAAVFAVIAILVVVTACFRKSTIEVSEGAYMGNDMNAAIYGLILAFLVVSMYQTSEDISNSVVKEVNSLVAIVNNTKTFSNAAEIQSAVRVYTNLVVNQEWPLLIVGNTAAVEKLSQSIIDPLYDVVQKSEPVGLKQQAFYNELPHLLADIVAAHRERLIQADSHLPIQFWRIINFMTLLVLWFLVYMNPWRGFHSIIPVIVPGVIIAFCLALLVSFQYPLIGPFSAFPDYYSTVGIVLDKNQNEVKRQRPVSAQSKLSNPVARHRFAR